MKFELEPYNRGENDAKLLDDLRSVARSVGKDYVTKDEYNERGRWCAATFQKRFGSWCKAHELAGLRKIRNYAATAEDCVEDLKRVAKILGTTTITTAEYRHNGGIFAIGLIARRCGSWKTALEMAGLAASPLYHETITNEQLFENLEHLWESLGRQPRRSDFVKPVSIYSHSPYARRFGSFRKALEAFVASFESHESQQPKEPAKEDAVGSILLVASRRHKTPRTISWRMRFLVMRRDNFRCCMCGVSPASKAGTVLVVDHVVPWISGGETIMENLQTSCEPCNGGKSDLPMKTDAEASCDNGTLASPHPGPLPEGEGDLL